METSLMSESVVNAGDVEESVTQVLTHFVQGGGEQAAMSVQLLAEQVEIDLGYEKGSLSKWHNFLGRTLRDFHYKDKGTKDIAHMLDLEDYGVTKKWVIITEISKEVENNAIARLNAYAKQYVPRRTGAAGGSSGGGASSGRS